MCNFKSSHWLCLLFAYRMGTGHSHHFGYAQCGDMLTALQSQCKVQHALKCFDGFRNIKAVLALLLTVQHTFLNHKTAIRDSGLIIWLCCLPV